MTKVQLGLTVCSVGPAAWEYTWPLWRRGDIYLNCARPGLLLLRTRISFVLDQSFKKKKKKKEILNLTLSLLQSALWFCVSPKHLSWLVAGLLVPSKLTVACCKYKRSSCSNSTGGICIQKEAASEAASKRAVPPSWNVSSFLAASRGRAGEKKEIVGTSVLPASFSTCKFVPYTLK